MNCLSFVACLWLLGGTLLTYGFPESTNQSNESLQPELKQQNAAKPSNGESEVYKDTHGSGAELKPNETSSSTISSSTESNSTTTTPATITTSKPTPEPPTTSTPPTTSASPTTSTPPTTAKPTTTTIPTEPTTTTTPNTTPPSTTHLAPTSIIPNSTQAPEPTKPTSAPETDRRFDGPSFIGGIVFALGVTAIGFVAWKFYKARTERNYHTL